MKLTNKSLYLQARDAILQMIEGQSGGFMERLPSEKTLSEHFGVSRNTIREAIKSLENEGLVSSRHGVGTFVLAHGAGIRHNISTLSSTTDIIESHGFEAGTQSMYTETRRISGPIARRFGQDETDVLYIERVRTADGKPVVYVADYIPLANSIMEEYSKNQKQSLLSFFEEHNITISFADCSIQSIESTPHIQKALALPSHTPLLLLQQMHYSSKNEPVFYSDSYFLTSELSFNLIRRTL